MRPLALALACAALGLAACSSLGIPQRSAPSASEDELVRGSLEAQIARLEEEVARLRADLHEAEESLVAIESGLRGTSTRADAVSALAEARIAVDRASRAAPWRSDELEEARSKLGEAERQLEMGHTGSAVFFASRARRIAAGLELEAQKLVGRGTPRFIGQAHANLRSGPSTHYAVIAVLEASTPVFPEREHDGWLLVRTAGGRAGWLHPSVLRPR